jgi:hypothetical protein
MHSLLKRCPIGTRGCTSLRRAGCQLESLHETVRSIVDETDVAASDARLGGFANPTHGWRSRLAFGKGDGRAVARTPTTPARGRTGRSRDRPAHIKLGRCSTASRARVDSLFDDPDVDQSETRFMGQRGCVHPDRARGA